MSSELDTWRAASGERGNPSALSKGHLRRAIKTILKTHEFYDLDGGRGEPDRTIGRIWDKAQGDPEAVAEAFGSAILEGRLSIGYVFNRLNGGRHQPATASSGTPTPSPDREEEAIRRAPQEPETAPLPVEDTVANFVFVNRSLRANPFLKKCPGWVQLFWVHLIVDVAWKDHEINWRGFPFKLERGQWIISCRKVAEDYGTSSHMVYHWLKRLKENGMIDFSGLYRDLENNTPWRVTGDVTGHVTGRVTGGTLITLCNYNKFQANFLSSVTGDVTGRVTGRVTQTEECITEEGKPKNVPSPKPPSVNPEEILKAYEENHGPLQGYGNFLMSVGNRKHAEEILSGLTEVCRTPDAALEKWIEVIKYAAANVDESNRWFIDLKWFAKDIDNCRKVLEGKFNHPFGRGENHGTRKVSGQGNFEKFGGESTSQAGKARAAVDASIQRRSTPVQRVPGHGMDLSGGQPGSKAVSEVQVLDRESGKGDNTTSNTGKVSGG